MATVVETRAKTKSTKNEDPLKAATASADLDSVLKNVKKLDNTCSFVKCKNRTGDFAIQCKYCGGRYCTTHGLPEIHGCGEAVRRDERRKYLHPETKLSEEKHSQAATKLSTKLKQMQLERKSKQGFASKGKKK